jgi:hypothetical protein
LKIWLDPGTAIMAGAQVFSGIASMAGASTSAGVLRGQGEAMATFYEQQQSLVDRELMEATVDLKNESQAAVSRAVAVSAAQGGDLDTDIISGIAGKYGMMQRRLEHEAEDKKWMLRARAHYSRQMGFAASEREYASGARGLGSLASGAYSLYKEGRTVLKDIFSTVGTGGAAAP